MYQIIAKRKYWLSFSAIIVALAITAIAVWGLRFGIDFTGGSVLEVRYDQNRPVTEKVKESLSPLGLNNLIIQPVGDNQVKLRFQEVDEAKHQEILSKLSELSPNVEGQVVFEELRYDSVGPSVGRDLRSRAMTAIILVILAIIAYVAWAFRKVSQPVSSWKYGVCAVIALFHDVIILLGFFALLGRYYGYQIDISSVAALLTILGYSVNDTIVVFDRTRENLFRTRQSFADTVNLSLNQTLTRSIYTSLTTMLTLVAIVIFGGASIRNFAVALSIGVFFGAYSSVFVASPLLVVWNSWSNRRSK
ncbi:protein translocase subunit SecF [Candidatus Falkowbacteria bacterium]|nr:protein translocase subunit SecF [Candidatus Falkowbacteria bacterium]